jgi:RNA polymerase sigma-70 factor, ECF subfamily
MNRFPEGYDRMPNSDALDLRDSTSVLIAQARDGDNVAKNKLASRYATALKRWAHGRLPARARGLLDTDDLVQSALYRGFSRLDSFEDRGDGAFLAYVRQILLNKIRDEARRVGRRPPHEELEEAIASDQPSPLERLIERDRLEAYDRALARLSPRRRESVILRLELGFSYREVAQAMGLPSGNAARLLTARAFLELSRAMGNRS